MYLPSNTPILQDQREAAARHSAESDIRIENMQRTSACGRARLFNTLVAPQQVAETIGMGTALDTAKLQAQTEASRGSAILGTGGSPSVTGTSGTIGSAGAFSATGAWDVQPTVAQIIADAPEVVSLNRGGGCTTPSYAPVPLGDMPRPGMPQRAPNIVRGPYGTMNYRGADATIPGTYPSMPAPVLNPSGKQGLTGYAPPWSDAYVLPSSDSDMGVGQWLMEHPWLALALAGGGLYALSRRNKAGA